MAGPRRRQAGCRVGDGRIDVARGGDCNGVGGAIVETLVVWISGWVKRGENGRNGEGESIRRFIYIIDYLIKYF